MSFTVACRPVDSRPAIATQWLEVPRTIDRPRCTWEAGRRGAVRGSCRPPRVIEARNAARGRTAGRPAVCSRGNCKPGRDATTRATRVRQRVPMRTTAPPSTLGYSGSAKSLPATRSRGSSATASGHHGDEAAEIIKVDVTAFPDGGQGDTNRVLRRGDGRRRPPLVERTRDVGPQCRVKGPRWRPVGRHRSTSFGRASRHTDGASRSAVVQDFGVAPGIARSPSTPAVVPQYDNPRTRRGDEPGMTSRSTT